MDLEDHRKSFAVSFDFERTRCRSSAFVCGELYVVANFHLYRTDRNGGTRRVVNVTSSRVFHDTLCVSNHRFGGSENQGPPALQVPDFENLLLASSYNRRMS